MDRLLLDLRFAVRTLLRGPAFTLVAVLILGLGIGATTSVVTVVNAVLLEGLPYPDADRLVLVAGAVRDKEEEGGGLPVSYLDFMDWRERAARTPGGDGDGGTRPFDRLVLFTNSRSFNLASDGEPERISGEMVTSGYFEILGIRLAQGRAFLPTEDLHPAGDRVAIVSDSLWRRRFGAEAVLSDQTLTLNEGEFRVIGVAPPGFAGMTDEAQLWVPVVEAARTIAPYYIEVRAFRWLSVLGSLAPGVGQGQATDFLRAVSRDLSRENPENDADLSVRLTPLAESWFGDLRGSLLALLGGAALVLLMAAVNVANLLLARATVRQREMAVRLAGGAGRGRLVGQLLVESTLLATGGLLLGLLLAHWATGALVALSAVDFKSFLRFGVDPTVLAIAVAITALAVLLFGLTPALIASRADLAEVLKDNATAAGGRGRQRLQRTLVVVEVAVAVVLLVGAGLLLRRFADLRATDLGFRAEGLLTLRADLQGPSYASGQVRAQLGRQFLEGLGTLPGVEALALVGPGMPTDDWYGTYVTVEDRVREGQDDLILANFHSVTPGTFSTLGVSLEGQDFTADDLQGSQPVVILSRGAADRFWPGEDPLGRKIKLGPRAGQAPWMTVIAVTGDVRQRGLARDETGNPDLYLPFFQFPPSSPPVFNFLVRPAPGTAPLTLAAAVREAVREIAPRLPVYDIATMEERLGRQLARDRFLLLLAGIFACLALLIAAVGIYGVLAFAVARRGREIAIRMALGAGQGTVLRRVVGEGMGLTALGLLLGFAASALLLRLGAGLLGDLELGHWRVYAAVAVVLLAVALAASFLPARRAARVEPMITLRRE